MIRFRAGLFVTDWEEETLGDLSTQTAAKRVAELRREHPDAVITLERSSVIPRKKQRVVRFKIKQKDDLYYSAVFPVEQKDIKLAQIREKHPKAEITAEESDG